MFAKLFPTVLLYVCITNVLGTLTWREQLEGRIKPKSRRLCCSPGNVNNGCGSCPSGRYDRRPFSGRHRPYWGGGGNGCTNTARSTGQNCCGSCSDYVGGNSDSSGGNINLPTMPQGTGYGSGTSQTRCSRCYGEVYNNAQSCRDCTAGKRAGNPWGSCSNCPAGQYQGSNSYTSSTCTACSSGQFSSSDGAGTCTPCPNGKFNSGSGSTSCIGCEDGKYVSR